MSIKPLHRIAARVRRLLNLKGHGWAVRGTRTVGHLADETTCCNSRRCIAYAGIVFRENADDR